VAAGLARMVELASFTFINLIHILQSYCWAVCHHPWDMMNC